MEDARQLDPRGGVRHLNVDDTEFCLSVCPAYTGRWVQKFHDCPTEAHASEVVATLITELEQRGELPSGSADHVQAFLDCDPAVRAKIIKNFSLVSCPNDPVDNIRQRLRMVSPSILDDVCRAAIGWVKGTTDQLIRDKKPAEIQAADFHKWFSAYLRKHDRDHLPASFAHNQRKRTSKVSCAFAPTFDNWTRLWPRPIARSVKRGPIP